MSHTVDGRNPVPVGIDILVTMNHCKKWDYKRINHRLAQDFFHPQE
jgi:hypothetical protein